MSRRVFKVGLAGIVALVCGACHSGTALIHDKSAPAVSSVKPAGAPSAQALQESSAGTAEIPAPEAEIAFEQVETPPLFDRNKGLMGLAFLPSVSQVTQAFGFSERSAITAAGAAAFAVSPQGLVFAYREGKRQAVIARRNTDTLAVTQLVNLSSLPTSVSSDAAGMVVGWTDATGGAFVYELATGKTTVLSLNGLSALSLNLSAWPVAVVQMKSQCVVIAGEKSVLIRGDACALDPGKTMVAASLNGDSSVKIYDRFTGTLIQELDLGGAPHELSWKSAREISFWRQTGDARGELCLANMTSGELLPVTELSFPQSMPKDSVCPAWLGNMVYFSAPWQGVLAILRTSVGSMTVKPFAVPRSESLSGYGGYVCPKVTPVGASAP